MFTYGRMGEFGVYQKVNLQESGTATFSIWMEAWMCRDYLNKCDSGKKSDIPTTMHFKVGIDPTGGTSATSSAIIWSKEGDSFDKWSNFSVSASVNSPVITVFTYARPDWDSARMNNDIYLDDASLTINAKPTPTPGPSLTCAKKAWQDDPRSTKGNYYLVKKYASGSTVTPGATFVYSIGYENSNAYQFTSTKITDHLPDNVDYVDADNFCSFNTGSRTVTCNVGTVAKGQKSQAAIRVKVKPSAPVGTLANIGAIQSKTTPSSECPLDLKIVR
jgi:hypothetical protein